MTTTTETTVTTQVYRVYIKATQQAIWDAITKPGVDAALRLPGDRRVRPAARAAPTAGSPPSTCRRWACRRWSSTGEVLEADPPRKLVQTWRFLWDEEIAAEGPTRVTFDIEEDDGGVTRLTVTHELENAPMTAAQLAGVGRLHEGGGGWSWVLSDLKTLLETGAALEG